MYQCMYTHVCCRHKFQARHDLDQAIQSRWLLFYQNTIPNYKNGRKISFFHKNLRVGSHNGADCSVPGGGGGGMGRCGGRCYTAAIVSCRTFHSNGANQKMDPYQMYLHTQCCFHGRRWQSGWLLGQSVGRHDQSGGRRGAARRSEPGWAGVAGHSRVVRKGKLPPRRTGREALREGLWSRPR